MRVPFYGRASVAGRLAFGTLTNVPSGIDLHLHTRASDGQWTPQGLVSHAIAHGIHTIAITDHDVTTSVKSAQLCGRDAGVRVISGVEVTAQWRQTPVHLLLYGDAVLDESIQRLLSLARGSIDQWARACLETLPDQPARDELLTSSHALTVADVVRFVRSSRVAGDHRQSARHIASLRPNNPPGLGLSETARAALDAGAVPVLAHPMRTDPLTRTFTVVELNALLDDVPAVQGIEVAHPHHDRAAQQALASVAVRRAILTTVGSDSHGPARSRRPIAWPTELAREFLARVR